VYFYHRPRERSSSRMGRFFDLMLAPLLLSGVVIAHGGAAHQKPLHVDEGADWMTRHMAGMSSLVLNFFERQCFPFPHFSYHRFLTCFLHANIPLEEHHISDFDASSFFAIHDYDNTGFWDRKDIHKTYGLADVSAKGISQEKQDEVVNKVLDLMDTDKDGLVSREEFVDFIGAGKTLPDFDLGPGHHGDIEFEYEIHHWEKSVIAPLVTICVAKLLGGSSMNLANRNQDSMTRIRKKRTSSTPKTLSISSTTTT
jgi:hypothetical protein